MKTILVTGGAGYIGSAAVKELISKNYEVIVVDNLSKGQRNLVDSKAKFYQIDLVDKEKLSLVFKENNIDAIMHFAGYKAVEESMENAVKYSDNITGTINLLNLMVKYKVLKIIFSSSAAVYGVPDKKIIDEETPVNPINFYGFCKIECEKIIQWYNKVHNIEYICLRYFNIAGDCGLKYIDEDAQNIFPIIMNVITGKQDKLIIFGDDYNTEDGTCVRDYIDINDLVDAHILSLDCKENEIINLGTGKGYSVKELINGFEKVTEKKISFEIGKKRKGDPEALIASNTKAKDILNWNPKVNLNDMIYSTYQAYL
jgi:UDP-glucose 4-epimerase